MALDSSVTSSLNEQINKELYSAYLYMTFADFFEDRGLKGYANWYVIQSQEELDHARILRRYLLDNDFVPTMETIAKPDVALTDDLSVLKAGLGHEQFITASINDCFAAAHKLHDYRTMNLLDWFIKEQGEEETNASDMIKDYELFGNDPRGLFNLDREYATRAYVQTTTMAM
ncbi:ferritin [Olsenella sp. DNF00959]|uniref:ferritin n=1 Tax=Olsenella sp. DNF00959 TaxID=1476999 RepID=UPI000782DF86|nr:ferritin [Olsenella sp. DNF00959]KXB62782.1 ferritin-like protein [Olsenella sp. DNF00959]